MNSCKGLLYVNASKPATDPLDDELTRGMQVLLDEAKQNTGFYHKASSTFREGVATKGWHTCICRATSTNVDYLISPNVATNSLCVHYLQCHRDEVSAEDMAVLRDLLGRKGEKRPRDEAQADQPEKKAKIQECTSITYMVSRTRLAELLARDGKAGDLSSLYALTAHMSRKIDFPERFMAVIKDNGNDFWIEFRERETNHLICRMDWCEPVFYCVLALIRSIGSEQ